MLRSMTGFGAGKARAEGVELSVELRTVNSKSLDLRVRLPRELGALEPKVHATVRERLSRGRVELAVELVELPGAIRAPRVDLAAARGYAAAYDALAASLGCSPDPEAKLALVWASPGVVEAPRAASAEVLDAAVDAAVRAALEDLEGMRRREGALLAAELARLLEAFSGALAAIRTELPRTQDERASRMRARLAEITGATGVDAARVAQEIAILLERADVTEELARLDAHLVQLRAALGVAEPVGRRLEFLIQEVQRETNTLGAKCSSAVVSHLVVEAKAALERLREQVQNVE